MDPFSERRCCAARTWQARRGPAPLRNAHPKAMGLDKFACASISLLFLVNSGEKHRTAKHEAGVVQKVSYTNLVPNGCTPVHVSHLPVTPDKHQRSCLLDVVELL